MTKQRKTWMTTAAVGLALAVGLAGCGGEDEHGLEEELCEHLEAGESTAVTAAEADPPSLSELHRRYEVSLPESGGQRGGNVLFVVDHGGEFVFGLSKDVSFELQDPSGNVVAPEEGHGDGDACEALAAVHAYDLTVGTYTVALGPTAEMTVSIVVEHPHSDEH